MLQHQCNAVFHLTSHQTWLQTLEATACISLPSLRCAMTECEFAQILRTLLPTSQCCKCKGNQQMKLVSSSWQEIVSTGASLSPGRWWSWRTQQRQQVALSASRPWKQSHSWHHCNFVGASKWRLLHPPFLLFVLRHFLHRGLYFCVVVLTNLAAGWSWCGWWWFYGQSAINHMCVFW